MSASPLKKKLKPPPENPHDEAHAQDLGTIIRKSIALAALDQLKTGIEAKPAGIKRVNAEEFVEGLWRPALNLVVRIDEETTGLICLDMPMVNTISDLLTGDIDDPIPDPVNQRSPTKIDAALCRGFVDQTLQELSTMLGEQTGNLDQTAFTVSHLNPDPSPHEFVDVSYQRATLELDINDGARKGRMCIILPAGQLSISAEQTASLHQDPVWQNSLKAVLNESRASLRAVLHRKKMPIGRIMRLKAGDILEIPGTSIGDIALETGNGANTVRHMTARLGEYQEMRAAKVIDFDRPGDDPAGPPKMIE